VIGMQAVETFHIAPGGGRILWILAAIVASITVGVTALVVVSARGARTSRFELSPAGLRLRGDLYGRFIPMSELRIDAARLVDLDAERTLTPRLRTMGTATPGYRAGWFRLSSGERALLFVTDPRRVVYLPTRRDYSLLLSMEEPERFLSRLRELTGPS
jgi:hypothetical protein